MDTKEKYPPPNVPPEHIVTFVEMPRVCYWAISEKMWLECNDAPEYYVVRMHKGKGAIQADSYENAKKHIEALAWLGEL